VVDCVGETFFHGVGILGLTMGLAGGLGGEMAMVMTGLPGKIHSDCLHLWVATWSCKVYKGMVDCLLL
jgi:hypothetical protein